MLLVRGRGGGVLRCECGTERRIRELLRELLVKREAGRSKSRLLLLLRGRGGFSSYC